MGVLSDTKEKKYASDNAQLMAEWNWERNADKDPSQLAIGSNKKAWWLCQKRHEWQAIICNRNRGTGCPECAKAKRKKP